MSNENPPAAPGPSYPSAPPPRASSESHIKPWVVALGAGATMAVLIAALANQWVIEKILKENVSRDSFVGSVFTSLQTYGWRLGPAGGEDRGRFWLSSVVTDVAVVALVVLLVVAVVGRRSGAGRVFAGTWMAVLVATLIGGYVRAAIIDDQFYAPSGASAVTELVFPPFVGGPYAIAGGVGFGLVVAAVAALLALVTKRPSYVATGQQDFRPVDAPSSDQPGPAPSHGTTPNLDKNA